MKTRYLGLLLLLFPLVSSGQSQIGIKGGYVCYLFFAVDNTAYDISYDYNHSAWAIAVSYDRRASRSFSPGLDLLYTNRSFSVRSASGSPGGYEKLDYHYTVGTIRLLVKPKFVMGSKTRFFIYPGLYLGARLHSTLDGTEKSWHMGSDAVTRTLDGTADGYYPDFEFGVLAGGGIEVPLTKTLGLVYENSVSINLSPVGSAWGPGNTKITDFIFELGVTYAFN